MQTTVKQIEEQIREYVKFFLKKEYGEHALKRLETFDIKVVDDGMGGISEVTGKEIRIVAIKDVIAGKLTNLTKLVIRHELGHILDDNSPEFPEFEQEIEHEKIAWANAKPENPTEHWYKNLSIRTHIDPLKMQSIGFPNPERKISPDLLEHGLKMEIKRMKKYSPFVDSILAKRFAMANLVEDPDYYSPKKVF